MNVLPEPVVTVTLRATLSAIVNADWLPVRVSPGSPPVEVPSTSSQRSRPELTSPAIQLAVTELSRPEKPAEPGDVPA